LNKGGKETIFEARKSKKSPGGRAESFKCKVTPGIVTLKEKVFDRKELPEIKKKMKMGTQAKRLFGIYKNRSFAIFGDSGKDTHGSRCTIAPWGDVGIGPPPNTGDIGRAHFPPLGPHFPILGPHFPPLGPHFPPLGPHFPPLGPHFPILGPHFPILGPHIPPLGPHQIPATLEGGQCVGLSRHWIQRDSKRSFLF